MSQAKGGEIVGHRIELDADRYVWVGRDDEHFYLLFVNGKVETRIALSREAAEALHRLLSPSFPEHAVKMFMPLLESLADGAAGRMVWREVAEPPK